MNPQLLTESAEFSPLLRGPSFRKVSSRELRWKGFVAEVHTGAPGERPESYSDRHILGLWLGRPVFGEHCNGRGSFVPYIKNPGTITLIPPGKVPAVRTRSRFEILLCALDPGFVAGVKEEMDRLPARPISYRTSFHDATLRQLMTLLAAEARYGGASGPLYADHIAHALTLRIFLLESDQTGARGSFSALPRHLLQRVLERMHDLCSDLNLQTLAAETGYSRAHFLRMFQLATGSTPHRYVLQLRVQRARELMKRRTLSLIDIAAACGFSSHSHMTRAFRQLLGVTPKEYRHRI